MLQGNFREISESEPFGTFPRNFRKRALFMGDHGRLSFDHVATKKSRGYYCPPNTWTDAFLIAALRRTDLKARCVTVLVDAVGHRSSEPHHGSVERFLFESSPVDDGCGDLDGRVFVDKNIFHLSTITIGHHRRPRRAAEEPRARGQSLVHV